MTTDNMNPGKKDLESREDVSRLVRTFYERVRKDEMLGPIFNSIISDWEAHLEKLTDFWHGNLFFFVKTQYTGDPKAAHQRMDAATGNQTTMEHFGRWINLWVATVDELYQGETAALAKNQARKMATFLFLKIFENRTS